MAEIGPVVEGGDEAGVADLLLEAELGELDLSSGEPEFERNEGFGLGDVFLPVLASVAGVFKRPVAVVVDDVLAGIGRFEHVVLSSE